MAKLEHLVIGNYQKFTLALGKYAFVPCNYIPKEYLEELLLSNLSDKDKKIILKHLKKNKKL